MISPMSLHRLEDPVLRNIYRYFVLLAMGGAKLTPVPSSCAQLLTKSNICTISFTSMLSEVETHTAEAAPLHHVHHVIVPVQQESV
jgi:hypothetical protein